MPAFFWAQDRKQKLADRRPALDAVTFQAKLGSVGDKTRRVATLAGTRIRAAVPWYGPNPPSGVENIAAPVFAIYGEQDERINAGIDKITQDMSAAGKSFEKKIYPGAQHAFNNDTNAERYNAEQAPIAWADMLAFFKQHLGA